MGRVPCLGLALTVYHFQLVGSIFQTLANSVRPFLVNGHLSFIIFFSMPISPPQDKISLLGNSFIRLIYQGIFLLFPYTQLIGCEPFRKSKFLDMSRSFTFSIYMKTQSKVCPIFTQMVASCLDEGLKEVSLVFM